MRIKRGAPRAKPLLMLRVGTSTSFTNFSIQRYSPTVFLNVTFVSWAYDLRVVIFIASLTFQLEDD
jgi:hypothetical protein